MARSSLTGTVILVEDDMSVSQALQRILRLAGLSPLHYESAEALLEAHTEAGALCMIFDVHLPGLDGFALHSQLSRRGELPPVIFMTAFDEPEARERARSAGAVEFLAKPFSGHCLVETVRRIAQPASPHP
jgi:FixJ family two-component response regulator